MKWWHWYRSAIRDMGKADIPGFSGRGRFMLAFVVPLGLLCMAVLFVAQIVEDPARLTTLDGFRRLGGIALMAAIFVGMGAVMIATFRSQQRKRQRWSEVRVDDSEVSVPVVPLSGEATFEISRRRSLLFSALLIGGGIVMIITGELWVILGVVAVVYGVALAIGLVLGPVSADERGVFSPFQWYIGRLKWDHLRGVELNARGSIVLRGLPGRSLYIPYDDLEDPEGLIAFVKAHESSGTGLTDSR